MRFITITIFTVLSLGCSTIHRAEINSETKKLNLIETVNLDDFFIHNGFKKEPMGGDNSIFIEAKRKDVKQTVLASWTKGVNETAVGRKTGWVDAWVVMEDQAYVVYISGSQSRSGQAVDLVNNLKVSLLKSHPEIDVKLSKSRFLDLR